MKERVLPLHMWNDIRKTSSDCLYFHYEGNQLVGMDGMDEDENAIDYIECLVTNLRKYQSKLIEHYGLQKVRKVKGSNLKLKLTHIYLMFDENTGYYKIGRSINPEYRERTLQSQAPKIIKIFNSPLTYSAFENKLHSHFQNKRVRGEWFDLTIDDVDYVKNYNYSI